MKDIFTQDEISNMSAEIDEQLADIETVRGPHIDTRRRPKKHSKLPEKQRRTIELNTKQNPETFLEKVLHALYKDLCLEPGVLYTQHKKLGDLSNQELIKTVGPILAGMGFVSKPLQTLVVASVVYILHIGIKVICEECSYGSGTEPKL